MANLSQTLAAGQRIQLASAGDFLRIQTGSGLRIEYVRNGQTISEIDNVGAGYSGRLRADFDLLRITNTTGAAQLVELVTASGVEHKTDTVTGTVSLAGVAGVFSDSVATVGTSVSTLFAANASRKALILQNRDASGNVWLRFGANPAVDSGLLIEPGQTMILDSVPAANDVRVIASVAGCKFYAAEA